MSAVAQYAYLHTRVSVLAESLLSPARLSYLFSHLAEDQTELLRAAGLHELADEPPASAQILEQALIDALLKEAAVVIRPLAGIARAVFLHWMRRFELINLKTILRAKLATWSHDEVRRQLLDLGSMAALPLEDLIHTEDIAELLRRLATTQYADMARQARRTYDEKKDVFDVEAALDRQFFAGLATRVNALPGQERGRMRPLVGALLDQVNLVWLLRFRFGYALAPAHTYFLLNPGGYHLGAPQLLAIVQEDSFERALEQLPPPLRDEVAGASSIHAVEARLEAMTDRTAYRVLMRTTFNLARAFAYLLLRERQLLRIHVAIKGTHLQIDPGLIRAAAVLAPEPGEVGASGAPEPRPGPGD